MNTQVTREFRQVFGDVKQSDAFYLFLQNIFHLFPEDKFHRLLSEVSVQHDTDQAVYQQVQAKLPQIKPFLQPLTYGLPALKKQKAVISGQTLKILGERKMINGYLEIGSTGRYISVLRKKVAVTGRLLLCNDIAPGNGPGDIMERGQFGKLGEFIPLDYLPLDGHGIAPASLDVVTCYIGLHHCPLDRLDAFLQSIRRSLRPGGLFILRDHDVRTPQMHDFVSLVHTVFNLGLDVPWAVNEQEFRRFRPAAEWAEMIEKQGFKDLGFRLAQDKDPTDNLLMAFSKTERP
ncbi:MAG: hypothetical protein RL095_1183 [Verrucomicrobiota bacterium]|jgi:hypothetical protein